MPFYLAMLLLVPILIGLVGFFSSKGRVTLKEFFVMELAVALVLAVGIGISFYTATGDVELWNGRVVKKVKERVSCEHSYSCNPYPCNCDKNGCQTCWQTCYEHSNDWDWNLYTNNNETITIKRVDRQGSKEPLRWTQAQLRNPTALQHRFTNYIKASPDTILRRRGVLKQFQKLVPAYPIGVYDYHYADRFVSVGVPEPNARDWNRLLQELNADLGPSKEVNIIVVAVKTDDPAYQYALEEAWVGGKKNDFIVLLGVTEYPRISWVRVSSWSKSEDLKVELRDAIQEIGTMADREKLVETLRGLVIKKFVRRHMSEFKYLVAGLQPGNTATVILFIVGLLVQIGLLIYFYREDPFDTGYQRYGRRW